MKLKAVIFGAVTAAAVTAAVVFAAALFSYFTDINEAVSSICVYIGSAAGVFLGSFCAARSGGGKVLLHAMAVSIICIAAIVIISLAINGRVNFDMHFWCVSFGSIISGFLGALAGRN